MEHLLEENFLKYYNQDLFAKTASSVMYDFAKEGDPKKVFEAKEHLLEKHPHNIVVRNSLNYFLHKLNQRELEQSAKEKKLEIIKKLNEANREVAKHAAKKIRAGSTVFVHSLNNHVLDTLLEAGKHKNFTVNVVDHEPFSFGRHLVKKMRKEGIKIKHFPDVSIHNAVTESDLCMLGGEAILKRGAVTKHGSKIVVEHAKKGNTPVYVCAHTWKYDKEEKINYESHEHDHSEHDHRKVYELIEPEHIFAYICEHGIFKPEHIHEEIYFYNKWMLI